MARSRPALAAVVASALLLWQERAPSAAPADPAMGVVRTRAFLTTTAAALDLTIEGASVADSVFTLRGWSRRRSHDDRSLRQAHEDVGRQLSPAARDIIVTLESPRRAIRPCFVLWCAFSSGMVASIGAPAAARPSAGPSLREVLARAGEYAVSYGDALERVVADEDFLQELVRRRDGAVVQSRRVESEIAFVKLEGTGEWLAFRSVLRVDGVTVSTGPGQLERLFRETPGSALSRARAITGESARHNLGPVQRTFNVPTTVLHFLLPRHQDRFRFRKISEERAGDETAWVVEFREENRATFIRTPDGRNAPSEGRLWILPDDGRLVRSRLIVKGDMRAELSVAWEHEPRLKLWVPVEMRESYPAPRAAAPGTSATDEPIDTRGAAKYSNYRRFDVDVRIVR